MNKHTPLPWIVDVNDIRCNPDEQDYGTFIAEMQSSRSIGETKANAEFIVRAVNCHYDLVEAVRGLLNWCDDSDDFENEPCLVNAIKAIKEAEGEG